MKKINFLKILIPGLVVIFGLSRTNILANIKSGHSTAQAVGDLTVDWGVPSGQAVFLVDNFMPGETAERLVTILNGASSARPVGIVGAKTEELKDLANVLEITISQNGTDLYGGGLGTKTLAQFFQESIIPNAIFLFNLNPGESRKINFKVKFQEGAENSFQKAKVVFDLLIGLYYQVPEECKGIKFSGSPIFGTQRNDVIKGTNGNDLIFGFEGNDKIDGSNGNDCLVGGDGNDKLDGSNGNDVFLGGEGNDKLDGSNGNDLLVGGGGDDIMDGSNGDDVLLGGAGRDFADGSNGRDRCEAEIKTKCEF